MPRTKTFEALGLPVNYGLTVITTLRELPPFDSATVTFVGTRTEPGKAFTLLRSGVDGTRNVLLANEIAFGSSEVTVIVLPTPPTTAFMSASIKMLEPWLTTVLLGTFENAVALRLFSLGESERTSMFS